MRVVIVWPLLDIHAQHSCMYICTIQDSQNGRSHLNPGPSLRGRKLRYDSVLDGTVNRTYECEQLPTTHD